jgi:hypothetical protein
VVNISFDHALCADGICFIFRFTFPANKIRLSIFPPAFPLDPRSSIRHQFKSQKAYIRCLVTEKTIVDLPQSCRLSQRSLSLEHPSFIATESPQSRHRVAAELPMVTMRLLWVCIPSRTVVPFHYITIARFE